MRELFSGVIIRASRVTLLAPVLVVSTGSSFVLVIRLNNRKHLRRHASGTWAQAKLGAWDGVPFDDFGQSVPLAGDLGFVGTDLPQLAETASKVRLTVSPGPASNGPSKQSLRPGMARRMTTSVSRWQLMVEEQWQARGSLM